MAKVGECLRSGQCPRCKAKFWWTGLIKSVPNCSCGRRLVDVLLYGRKPKQEN